MVRKRLQNVVLILLGSLFKSINTCQLPLYSRYSQNWISKKQSVFFTGSSHDRCQKISYVRRGLSTNEFENKTNSTVECFPSLFLFDIRVSIFTIESSRLLELSRARVYFACPTIAIAKIREFSQSNITYQNDTWHGCRWTGVKSAFGNLSRVPFPVEVHPSARDNAF